MFLQTDDLEQPSQGPEGAEKVQQPTLLPKAAIAEKAAGKTEQKPATTTSQNRKALQGIRAQIKEDIDALSQPTVKAGADLSKQREESKTLVSVEDRMPSSATQSANAGPEAEAPERARSIPPLGDSGQLNNETEADAGTEKKESSPQHGQISQAPTTVPSEKTGTKEEDRNRLPVPKQKAPPERKLGSSAGAFDKAVASCTTPEGKDEERQTACGSTLPYAVVDMGHH